MPAGPDTATSGSEYQYGGQVVDDVGQHRRDGRDPEQREEAVTAGQHRAHRLVEAVQHHRIDHDAEAQHERQEGHVDGVTMPVTVVRR